MREGWKEKTIGEVCDVVNGGTPKTGVSGYWGGSYQWITPAEMGKRVTPYIQQTERTITSEGLRNSSARLLPPHSVILSSRAPIGYLVINTAPMATNQGCKGLVPNKEIDHKFLFYYLESIVKLLNELGSGATFKELSSGKLKEIPIPIAPLPEQRRIVAILDEAFEGIATAKANAEKNLQNTHEVFESHMNAVFSQRGEGWVEKSLGELATLRNGINFSKARSGETIKILGVKDFQYNYWAPIDNFDTIVSDGKIKSSDILKENDIVFVRSNGNPELIGRCLLVGRVNEKVTHSGFTIRARLSSSDVNIQYLCHFLKLRETHRKMIDGGNGISIKSLNQETLSNLIIPLPRLLEKQTKIVNQVEKLSAETQHLEFIYEKKLTALDELKQSLLHQAFNGDL